MAPPAGTKQPATLKVRSIRRLTITIIVLALILLGSAGTMRFWQAWLFVGLQAGLWIFFFVDFLRSDPNWSSAGYKARRRILHSDGSSGCGRWLPFQDSSWLGVIFVLDGPESALEVCPS